MCLKPLVIFFKMNFVGSPGLLYAITGISEMSVVHIFQ